MKLRIQAPEGERRVELDPGGAPMVAGRGNAVALHLPDPARNLSREHVSFRRSGGVVAMTVLSKVAGVTTSRGLVAPGGQIELAAGDSVTLGAYTIAVEAAAAAPPAPGPASPAAWMAPPPFLRPAGPPPAGPAFVEFHVPGAALPAAPGFSAGGLAGAAPADDPLQVIGGGAPAGDAAGPRAIDDFLAGDAVPPPPAPIAPLVIGLPPMPAGQARPSWRSEPSPAAATPAPARVPAPEPAAAPVAAPDDLMALLRGIQVPGVPGAAPVPAPAFVPPPPLPAAPEATQPLPVGLNAGLNVGPPSAAAAPVDAPAPPPTPAFDATAFARGLGMPVPECISADDWVRIGSTLRQLAEAMGQLMQDRKALKGELRALNKTQFYLSENNPYKMGLPIEALLRHLLWGGQADGAYMAADKAVREAIDDLRAHNLAIIAASRASVEGTVREFSPDQLKRHLTTTRAARVVAFMEHGQLWRSYLDYYEDRSTHMADWLEALFERHFVAAYSREADRLSQQHIPLP